MQRRWNTRILLVGVWNGGAAVENILAVPQKVKDRIVIRPSNSTRRFTAQRSKNGWPNKNKQ